MKKTGLTAIATVLAAPAFAHGGAHLHPHGFETLTGFVALAVIATAGYLALRNK